MFVDATDDQVDRLVREGAIAAIDDDRLLTEVEVAELLNVTPRTVFTLERDGRIACVRIGRAKRYRRGAVLGFIREAEQTGGGGDA